MMDEVEVQVGLPRFKLEETYDLKTVLVSMGMVDAFDMAKSDFSGRTCAKMYSTHQSMLMYRVKSSLLSFR